MDTTPEAQCVLQDTIGATNHSKPHTQNSRFKIQDSTPLLIPNRRMIFSKLAWSAKPSASAVLLT